MAAGAGRGYGPERYMVMLRPATANLLRQVCQIHSTLSAVSPRGRMRCQELARQFAALANGADGLNLANDADGLIADELSGLHFPEVPERYIYHCRFSRKDGTPLQDDRAAMVSEKSIYQLERAMKLAHRPPPVGLISWLHSARPGDMLSMWDSERGVLYRVGLQEG